MNKTQKALKERYSHLHPLIFHRSLEKSNSDGELFDILDSVPEELPVVWDEEDRRWVHTTDILQGKNIIQEGQDV